MSEQNAATKVVIGPVRLSYLHCWEPVAMEEGQTKKYQVTLMVPKSDTKMVKAVNDAIAAAKELGKSKKWEGKIPNKLEISFKDGDESDKPEYADHFIISAKSENKPGVVDRNRQPIVNRDEIYSGAYGYVSINWYPYNKPKNGVACGLNNIMKWKDGERFGGFATPDEDFAALPVEEDDMI